MIRTLQKKDIDKVADIWLDTNQKAHDFIPAQYWQNHYEMVKEMFSQAEIYIYEEDDKIQGFIGLTDTCIEGIFVQSKAQSVGIGKQLLDFIKNRKRQLTLNVYQKNTRAVRFYQRENFKIQRESVDENTKEKEYSMIWKSEERG